MKFYLAPLEGLTGYIYRNTYAKYFGEVDKYFTPFIAANQHGKWSGREKQDVSPVNNSGKKVIPQVLTNNIKDFKRTAEQLAALGYDEMNLNLGCPSGTVVSKGKGSGFLGYPEALETFLEAIFEQPIVKISIKTRLGVEEPEEFEKILQIFNQYPMEELIIHPRVRKAFYKDTPNLEVFAEALKNSRMPVCYNGDLFTAQDYERIHAQFPEVDRMMFGRGILANPSLIVQIKKGEVLDKARMKAFHDELYEAYQEVLSGDRNILFKMKEMWFYMANAFEAPEKYIKQVKKSQKCTDYEHAVAVLFENCQVISTGFSKK